MAMMYDSGVTFERFKKELGNFLLQIQTARTLDVQGFERLDVDCKKLAYELKSQPFVPKAVLWEIRAAAKIMRAESKYIEKERDVINGMADRLEWTFDLILLGESHDDRTPGVPRIVLRTRKRGMIYNS